MSNKGRSGINRPFSWLKKVLEITEKTTAPDTLMADVRAMMDVFGWERYPEMTALTKTGTAVNNVTSEPVPAQTNRLVTAASIETDDLLAAYTYWLEYNNTTSGLTIGLTPPLLVPISGVPIRSGLLSRPFLMSPGDTINARCSPNQAAGQKLRLRWCFIDLPLGEYIPPV